MKKSISFLLTAALTVTAFTGCSSNAGSSSSASSAQNSSAPASSSATAAGSVKTGVAVISSVAKSTAVKDGKGVAEGDSTIVAVTVDGSGKIVKCVIDAVQSKINFSDQGKILDKTDAAVKSKDELGADYGLGKVSKIKKDWNEQAQAFADYVKGKTVEEIKGIAVDSEGHATGTELTSSVTISIGDFVDAIEQAVANAQDLGAKANDKLGLGIVTSLSSSADATADQEGKAEASSQISAVTFGSDGKITSCVNDAVQPTVSFDVSGKITTDLSKEVESKDALKESYGMKKASKIGKEWYQQAASFAQYVKGKTVDEVKGIKVNESGEPTDQELTASVTFGVSDFIANIEEASKNAK
ncbi:hypothetical protein [Caproicibacter fermentans]|uniref:FMN-binding domain-containing protein n=1 Tax=Caproicibacter fermentans TaxID=2576756 RepID=A0A7G8TDP4_9FIRM|nr:hypothetical protein [Caproicibacter fermentans]QNK41735.1 hypothetical protein HCR03_05665 [Caproicibacter fermentans]